MIQAEQFVYVSDTKAKAFTTAVNKGSTPWSSVVNYRVKKTTDGKSSQLTILIDTEIARGIKIPRSGRGGGGGGGDGSHAPLKREGLRRSLSAWPNTFLLLGEIWKFATESESSQSPELNGYSKRESLKAADVI